MRTPETPQGFQLEQTTKEREGLRACAPLNFPLDRPTLTSNEPVRPAPGTKRFAGAIPGSRTATRIGWAEHGPDGGHGAAPRPAPTNGGASPEET